jgi:ABC-type amino acid transport system permease subunit
MTELHRDIMKSIPKLLEYFGNLVTLTTYGGAIYLLFAFIAWDINAANWQTWIRFVSAIPVSVIIFIWIFGAIVNQRQMQ